mmetsp:Transcript_133418/g.231816  ORF Transcript_133418/g.231816 Transcript_133418/m.231816 type:complete len:530 (-) Transcript_133418:186-1775(-)
MYVVALLLSCLICAGHGRRLQTTSLDSLRSEHYKPLTIAERALGAQSPAAVNQSVGIRRPAGGIELSKALAMFLACNPAAAFSGAQHGFPNLFKNHPGHRIPVMHIGRELHSKPHDFCRHQTSARMQATLEKGEDEPLLELDEEKLALLAQELSEKDLKELAAALQEEVDSLSSEEDELGPEDELHGIEELEDEWPEEVVDMGEEGESEAEIVKRALQEENALRDAPGVPLTAYADAAQVLEKDGVIHLSDALSTDTAVELRKHILAEHNHLLQSDPRVFANDLVISGDSTFHEDAEDESLGHYTAMLASHMSTDGTERRWDMRLRLSPLVKRTLHELLAGSFGEVLEQCIGSEAKLYELAAFIAVPGAGPQPLHPDVQWKEDGGSLFTVAVALQTVHREMGPTQFLRGTHTYEAQEDFYVGVLDGTFLPSVPKEGVMSRGLLETGEALVYDGRVLHAGSANVCDEVDGGQDPHCNTRVLFYVTFQTPELDLEETVGGQGPSLLKKYRNRFTLGQLRTLGQNKMQTKSN